MSREQFYKTKVWDRVRINIWLKQNCLCNRCNKPVYVSGITPYLPKDKRVKGIVHHKIHLNESNYVIDEIALDESNLEGLCIDCHNKEHFSCIAIRNDLMFDEYGNVVPK